MSKEGQAPVQFEALPARVRPHFLGLTEMRAVAALAVVVHHVERYKRRWGYPSLYETVLQSLISSLGKNAVDFFFVLSGFLITYLLVHELGERKRVDIRKFYLRRLLRIWPLYYLFVLIAFVAMPAIVDWPLFGGEPYYTKLIRHLGAQSAPQLALCMLFLPNVALGFFPPVVGMSHAWSIGVEEQFYLIWPWLFRARIARLVYVLAAFLAAKLIGNLVLDALPKTALAGHGPLAVFAFVWRSLQIELMSLGGLMAYACYVWPDRMRRLLGNRLLGVVASVVMLVSLITDGPLVVLGSVYAILIAIVAMHQPKWIQSRVMRFVGDISFGVYMYHPIVMFLVVSGLTWIGVTQRPWLRDPAIYTLVVAGSIGIAYLSNRTLERRFMRLKDRVGALSTPVRPPLDATKDVLVYPQSSHEAL
jgi:peptidoglycan/LPS O-acetylase OafA/YrhL